VSTEGQHRCRWKRGIGAPGDQIGGRVRKKVNTKYLRLAVAVIIAITGLRMWYQVLTGH